MKPDPTNPGNKIRTTALAVLLLASSHALASLGPLSWLIPVALGYGMMVAIRERAWLCLILTVNPFTINLANGVRDYANGAPSLRSMGLPGTEFSNVDRETRCFTRTGGCLVQGDEWVSDLPHNLALRVLCMSFGAPTRSYDGPYPDKNEALRLVSSSPLLNGADFTEGTIQVAGKSLHVDRELMDRLSWDFLSFYTDATDFESGDIGTHVQAHLLEDRCLILRLKSFDHTDSPDDPGQNECIVLFDRKNMRPFAYYRIAGNPLPRFPRVQYLAERSR